MIAHFLLKSLNKTREADKRTCQEQGRDEAKKKFYLDIAEPNENYVSRPL